MSISVPDNPVPESAPLPAETGYRPSSVMRVRGRKARGRLRVVGIGASAGGLEAFTELLRSLASNAELAYVLVQHLDPTHRSLLCELLAKATSLPVKEITDGMPATANEIHVIPPNCDLTISNGILRLTVREKAAGPARSIDHFLKSLAADQKENAIGVILSGAGSDGAEGLKAIKEAGGITFAQDEASARYDSMPRSAVATGCVDFVLAPEKIATEIAHVVRRPGGMRSRSAANVRRRGGARGRENARPFGDDGTDGVDMPAAPSDDNLRKIFHLLRSKTGVDFGNYRINTVRRRLARRLAVTKMGDLESYVQLMRRTPAEIDALHQDLLINVTSFFRNPSVFESLKKRVFPKLAQQRDGSDPIRIWIAGCSTGQEAYSIAIAYAEFAQKAGPESALQIFATDVNPSVLEIARAGRYTAAQVENLSPARLQRFFVEEGDCYRVQKSIRDRVVFAQQNLLTHPPFTRVDLISCRNLLIYLEPALQQKIIPTFHYALKPGGYLLLGSSESVGQFGNLFDSKEKASKLFVRKAAPSWVRPERPLPFAAGRPVGVPVMREPDEFNVQDAQKEADRLTLAKYAPAAVLIDENGEILQFRGDVRRYLELPKSRASFQLFKMARAGLEFPLRRALLRARRRNAPAREIDSGRKGEIEVEVVPLKSMKRRCFLAMFRALPPPAAAPAPAGERGKASRANAGADRRLTELKQEYSRAREHLQTLQEAHDTSMEELQSSNEEVQSANEELQSLNEELETSNEELESANEELTTLNEELGTRNAELKESERRLREQQQLLELAPVLVRSPKDRIIFWNRGAEKMYGYTKDEAIGQISTVLLDARFPEPIESLQRRLQRDGRWEGEVQHRRKDGTQIWVATQWVVHADEQSKVRAVLEINIDITGRKKAEEALRESEAFVRSVVESSPDCIQVLNLDGRINFVSPEGLKLMGASDAGSCHGAYWPGLWDPAERETAEKAYRGARDGETVRFLGRWRPTAGSDRWWDVAVRPVPGEDGKPQRLLVVSRDITEHQAAAAERERLLQETMAAREEVEVLNKVGRLIAAELDLEKLSQAVTDAATALTGAEFGALFHLSENGQGRHYSLFTFTGSSREALTRLPLPGGPAGSEPLFDRNGPIRLDDIFKDPRFEAANGDRERGQELVRSYLSTPVISRSGQILGGLFFGHSRAAVFTEREERIISGLAAQASVAMDNARIFDQLERKVEERTAKLRETIAELQGFSYTVSHDLRAPLRAMQSYAQVMVEEFGTILDARGRDYLGRIEKAGLRLDRLIQDVLTYSRMSQAAPAFRPVNLEKLIREIIEQYPALQAWENAVTITGPLPMVLADESSATQCLSNLLGNAVKFVPRDRQPLIRIRAEEQGEKIRLWVEDNGIGIAPENQERIFKMFERVSNDGDYEGTGIGLAIVRKAMERMQGGAGVESKLGEGSRFWLDFRRP